MKFIETPLPGVILVEPRVFRDQRGFFLETYHQEKYRDGGIPEVFVQDNHSRSVAGTLRGLHSQRNHPQGKLVRCVEGEIWDVAVDIRSGSPTFRQWFGATLTAENFHQLYVPPGFAHGFCVLSDVAQVEYKCTDLYHPEDEQSVRFNDPDLGIDWPPLPTGEPLLSGKDREAPFLADILDQLPHYDEP
jgi:dTDP-4-dehydrorhamnose 3,5-epimerase